MDRSFLFVPGNRPERFDKACNAGAHAVIVDLEDAVASADKAGARGALAAWLDSGKRAWVRVNGRESEWFEEDLAIAAHPGVVGVAEASGDNAVRLDGKLVDRPVIERARALIAEATP